MYVDDICSYIHRPIKRVTVGGVPWNTFDPALETVDVSAAQLRDAKDIKVFQDIVVYYK